MDKQSMRLAVVTEALELANNPRIEILDGAYATQRLGGLTVCILGGMTLAALRIEIRESAVGDVTVREAADRLCELYTAPSFIIDVLSVHWPLPDLAPIETAFEGDVTKTLAGRIRMPSTSLSLWDFYNCGNHENVLKTDGERSLVSQLNYARTLRGAVPDAPTRYRRILSNMLKHGGLYNPRG